ncbi:hypothetical protein KJY73_21465 [Bowmanella sp. Y26]|uniref:hypothetical protein n=1 Tax=Bowmanella yangjiangensis TaxID=2811230 RepID=UPI001BDCB4EE|nr:hypothetical protein [Bowmanella yangjiangensis]MBT1066159.1 hypothetical protein [Bowmanella yangjiangensis]
MNEIPFEFCIEPAIQIFEPMPLDMDEDCIALYEGDGEYIHYVRHYGAQVEFIVVSDGLIGQLPEWLRPSSRVFVRKNFYALKQFRAEIRQYVIESGQNRHFSYLFQSSLGEFFDDL